MPSRPHARFPINRRALRDALTLLKNPRRAASFEAQARAATGIGIAREDSLALFVGAAAADASLLESKSAYAAQRREYKRLHKRFPESPLGPLLSRNQYTVAAFNREISLLLLGYSLDRRAAPREIAKCAGLLLALALPTTHDEEDVRALVQQRIFRARGRLGAEAEPEA